MKFVNMNLVLFVLLAFASCTPQADGKENNRGKDRDQVILQGKIDNPATSGHIVLEEIQNNNVVPVDTLALGADNTFSDTVTVKEPGFFRLNLYGKQFVMLVLNREDINISADLNSEEPAVVEGSKDTDFLEEINTIVQHSQEEVKTLEQEYVQARDQQNQARMKELENQYMQLDEQKRERVKSAMRNTESSVAHVYGVSYLSQEEDFPFLDSLAVRLTKDLPDSKYVQDFTIGVNSMRSTVVGQTAPEISLPNPEGETKSLSDLRGNVVLIDFWAAWCGPCRRENPNVVRMYNKYSDKGFEIFGVSLDRNREDWVKAIEKDGLAWTQVSDLSYFNSEAARTYNINAIPATVLLDKEGKIIARNLRGAELEAKLAEIFEDL